MGECDDGNVDAEGQAGDLENPANTKKRRVRIRRVKTVTKVRTVNGTEASIEQTTYEREEFDGLKVENIDPPRGKIKKMGKVLRTAWDMISQII